MRVLSPRYHCAATDKQRLQDTLANTFMQATDQDMGFSSRPQVKEPLPCLTNMVAHEISLESPCKWPSLHKSSEAAAAAQHQQQLCWHAWEGLVSGTAQNAS